MFSADCGYVCHTDGPHGVCLDKQQICNGIPECYYREDEKADENCYSQQPTGPPPEIGLNEHVAWFYVVFHMI